MNLENNKAGEALAQINQALELYSHRGNPQKRAAKIAKATQVAGRDRPVEAEDLAKAYRAGMMKAIGTRARALPPIWIALGDHRQGVYRRMAEDLNKSLRDVLTQHGLSTSRITAHRLTFDNGLAQNNPQMFGKPHFNLVVKMATVGQLLNLIACPGINDLVTMGEEIIDYGDGKAAVA